MVSFVQTWWIINEFARPILATWYGMYDVYGTARDCGFWWVCVTRRDDLGRQRQNEKVGKPTGRDFIR